METDRSRFFVRLIALALILGFVACEPNSSGPFFPEGLNTITVLVRNNVAYPIFQFTCAEAEGPGQNESCPAGFECDGQHYHGKAFSIGRVAPTGVSDVDVNVVDADDPDACHCGWGKVGEADVRELTVFKTDVELFTQSVTVPEVSGLTTAQAMSVDPCGG